MLTIYGRSLQLAVVTALLAGAPAAFADEVGRSVERGLQDYTYNLSMARGALNGRQFTDANEWVERAETVLLNMYQIPEVAERGNVSSLLQSVRETRTRVLDRDGPGAMAMLNAAQSQALSQIEVSARVQETYE